MLPQLKIASPCPASWENMTGNNQVRHCSQCNLNVYNFSAMTSHEIETLISASEGQRLCGRLYQRADGTLLTQDCPVGLRTRIRRVTRRVGAALAAAMSFAVAAEASPQQSAGTMGKVVAVQTGFNLAVLDASGAPVPHSRILLINAKTHKTVAENRTDNAGKFSFSHLPVGDYTAIVEAPGLLSQSALVSIKPNAMQDITFQLRSEAFVTGLIALPAQLLPLKVQIK
jgi:Carboxypeptidase regulatory-like domain